MKVLLRSVSYHYNFKNRQKIDTQKYKNSVNRLKPQTMIL